MSLEYRIGDVFDRLAEIPDGTIDLIVTSPPFLALRSYLPDDHEHKGKEIGSEPTPAEFIDTLLALSAEWGRVLAPHGSLCVELGDTFSGNYPAGSTTGNTYKVADAWRDGRGQPASRSAVRIKDDRNIPSGWPLAKSLTGIPTLYPWSLAYGRNLLTGTDSPAGQWRIRNVIVWARPNPPVGALGDKWRPATSYITVACKSAKRYFDLDAVRHENVWPDYRSTPRSTAQHNPRQGWTTNSEQMKSNPAGAPPLDWHADNHPEDGDWLWKLSTQPYKGSHYATYPLALPKKLIEAMCPLRVCTTCGKPSERITTNTRFDTDGNIVTTDFMGGNRDTGINQKNAVNKWSHNERTTDGWTDCQHNTWRTGIVLDPFAGSGTTLDAAQAVGRHAIGIDLDERNAHLAQARVGMFMEIQP